MELGLELEWELELEWLEWELEWELVLKPRNPREFQPGAQTSALWAQMALLGTLVIEIVPLGPFLEPLSKPEKWPSARGDRPYNSHSQSRILIKSALSKNPMVVFSVTTPPFSSISLLLAVHARNVPPSTVEAVRQVRLAAWAGRLRSGSGQISVSI